MEFCTKHSDKKSVGKCYKCGCRICAGCRRYDKGNTYCKTCYSKKFYEERKILKDKLQSGKHSYKYQTSKSGFGSGIIQLFIIALIGLICYKIAEKKGVIPKNFSFDFPAMVKNIKTLGISNIYKTEITKTKIRNFVFGINSFRAMRDRYPRDFDELVSIFDLPDRKKVSFDGWNTKFNYEPSDYPEGYIITSAGKDKQFNTEDDIIYDSNNPPVSK